MTPAIDAPRSYRLVDVFSPAPYGGNSLPVFTDARGLGPGQMQRITQELRHFESIFLEPTADPHRVRARVFDLKEELPFAGHPLIGAAAVLHHTRGDQEPAAWQIELPGRTVSVTTERTATGGYYGLLDQGTPEFIEAVVDRELIAQAFDLSVDDLATDLPLEIVSTGLRYLIVPLRPLALGRARIRRDITGLLTEIGAQFAVLLDEAELEVRHWNNDGIVEDIATGSAAGTIGAYRLRHNRAAGGTTFVLQQGRFTGRPSRLLVQPEGESARVHRVLVGGEVALVGSGTLDAVPAACQPIPCPPA